MPSLPNASRHSPAFHVEHKDLVRTLSESIDAVSVDLIKISEEMHEYPEIAWKEHRAAKLLTAFMEEQGFIVKRGICDIETAWSAEFEVGTGGVTIGFNSEMDALPGQGHGCGHNLIAIAGCAAAVGVAQALKSRNLPGRVLLLGTPAEEQDGGKINMLEAGAYDSMATCLMVHPWGKGKGAGLGSTSAKVSINADYTGIPAHAAGSPESGRNALDAAVIAYSSIHALRGAVPPGSILFGIIRGSESFACNIIPEFAGLTYSIRATSTQVLDPIAKRVVDCMNAAALATGCTVKIGLDAKYDELQNEEIMAGYFKEFATDTWGDEGYTVEEVKTMASTDFGNVTFKMPGLHPMFSLPNVEEGDHPHSSTFVKGTAHPEAHAAALKAAVGISVCGLRVAVDPDFRQASRASWQEQMKAVNSSSKATAGKVNVSGGCSC